MQTSEHHSHRLSIVRFRRFARRLVPALALAALLPGAALAGATTITVTLWDKGATSMDGMDEAHPMGMAMMDAPAMKTMMPMVTMGIRIDRAEVPAGAVTFAVTNASTDIIHEMIVAPVADPMVPVPYAADEVRVDEEAAGSLGEVSELDPGKVGSLTLTLTPGDYLLYCNIPGHYIMGMWTLVTVTP